MKTTSFEPFSSSLLVVEPGHLECRATAVVDEYASPTACILVSGRAVDRLDRDASVHVPLSVTLNPVDRRTSFVGVAGQATYLSVEVAPQWFDRHDVSPRDWQLMSAVGGERVRNLARAVLDQWRCVDRWRRIGVESAFATLVLEMLRKDRRRPPAAARWLSRVHDLLRAGPPGVPSLGGVAAELGVHPAHLARVVRQATGMTLGDLARAHQVERACALIDADAQSLAEIALGCGFADQSHFTRVFRHRIGCTPSEYRRSRRNRAAAIQRD